MELRDRNFILIDIETTGFDEKKHQILEIGILVIKDLKLIYSLFPWIPEILFFISRGKKPIVAIPLCLKNLLSLYPGVIIGSNLYFLFILFNLFSIILNSFLL